MLHVTFPLTKYEFMLRAARTKFCRFLHEHKGIVVRSLDVFLSLNSCSRIARLISVFKKLCSHQPWFFVCSRKINLPRAKDAPPASDVAHAWCGCVYQPLVIIRLQMLSKTVSNIFYFPFSKCIKPMIKSRIFSV